jgi:predicted permease
MSRNAFVVAQVALSLALLIGSGLLINTYWRYARVDVGLDAERVLVVAARLADRYFERVPAPEEFTVETGIRTVQAPNAGQREFLRETIERLEALPGVESVAAWNFFTQGNFDIRGRPTPDDRFEQRALFRNPVGDVVSTLGIELRAGSLERLATGETGVVAINQTFADRYFAGEDPIGRILEFDFPGVPDSEIIAIVGDDRYNARDLREEVDPEAIMPFVGGRQVHFLVRTQGDPLATADAARQAIWSVDPDQPIRAVTLLEDLVYESVTRERIFAQLLGFFALIGLFLALLGIYGVISLFVALATREIGVRIALGARPTRVVRLVVGRATVLTGAGIAIGLTVALASTRYLEALLHEISPTDAKTYAVLTALVAIAALAASYVPALRATRIDPVDTLRVE